MARSSVVIRLAGESGEGVISSGDILTQAAARGRSGPRPFVPIRPRSRAARACSRCASARSASTRTGSGRRAGLLQPGGLGPALGVLHPEGAILFDDGEVELPDDFLSRAHPVRMDELAKEMGLAPGQEHGGRRRRLGRDRLRHTPIEQLVLPPLRHKQGVADANIAALHAGEGEAADLAGTLSIPPPPEVEEDRSCSPATRPSAWARWPPAALLRRLPDHAGHGHPGVALGQAAPMGGVTIQSEDEIASRSAAVVGASYAGAQGHDRHLRPRPLAHERADRLRRRRPRCPCVIVDAQRGGPSTGLPTKTEQSDLQHALYGGHGEAPRIVLAAGLGRGLLLGRHRRLQLLRALPGAGDPPDRPGPGHAARGHPPARRRAGWRSGTARRRPTPAASTAATSTRRTRSRPWACPASRAALRRHRHRARRAGPPRVHARDPRGHAGQAVGQARAARATDWRRHEVYGEERPEVAVIGFGSTYGPVREAVDMARADGLSVGAFYPRVLGPSRPRGSRSSPPGPPRRGARGQLHRAARPPRPGRVRLRVRSHAKSDGLPFTAEDVHAIIIEEATA